MLSASKAGEFESGERMMILFTLNSIFSHQNMLDISYKEVAYGSKHKLLRDGKRF